MRVYIMRFDTEPATNRAFGLLLDHGAVESSLVGPDPRLIRFMAKPSDADPLIYRIYLQGGLAWCSSHESVRGARTDAAASD